MQDAQTVLHALKQTEPLPPAPVDPAQLAKWAAETEIEAGTGSAQKGGRWKVYLFHSPTRKEAEAISARLREAGYAAQLIPQRDSGNTVFWVYLEALPNRSEARALAHRLRGQMGITETSVTF
jgi:cell division septation protein DedD